MPARRTSDPVKATAEAVSTPDFAALLAGAKLPETIVPLCLRADLAAEHEQLDRELEKLLDKPVAKFGGDGRGELKARIEALEAEMQTATYPVRLRALPRREWHPFVNQHPPRPGEDADSAVGVNTETFFPELIRRCVVDPALSDEQFAELDEKLTDRQYDSLSSAAWGLNRRDINIPFSPAVSRMNRSSEPESN